MNALAPLAIALAFAAAPAKKGSDGPPDLVAKAYGAAEEKRYCDAIPLFLSLHERAPQAKHLYRAAEVALAAGDRRLALDLYRSVLESYPSFEKKKIIQERVKLVEKEIAAAPNYRGASCPDPATVCGDWIVRPGEQCDDGNLIDGDGCDGNCTLTGCGNGRPTAPETCDDGNLNDGDGCDGNCTISTCGNGIVTGTEQCDDGNRANGDGCDNNCTKTACGNGELSPSTGETCDDGNDKSGDGCDRNCLASLCGNGALQEGEQCDDGNNVDGDGCDKGCLATACGNGVVTSGETCDDGNTVDGDGCDRNCTASQCGNGVVTAGEQCDDGNLLDGDGCSSACTRPAARMLAGASAFGGSALLVTGVALGILGGIPAYEHAQVSDDIRLAEARVDADPAGALADARDLQAQAAVADEKWRDYGFALVVGGSASLVVGGGLLALGFMMFEGNKTAVVENPDDEERVP